MATTTHALSWAELETLTNFSIDYENGPTNAQSTKRLFGHPASDIRVVLYRDNHAWCPYCQKIWIWLEEKQIPYAIQKVTMFCYGEKESWYKKIVPSGMLPAIALDGEIITESADILIALERTFGPLHKSMIDSTVVPLRRLERLLFRAWCSWLCYPARSPREDNQRRQAFVNIANQVEDALAQTPGPFFLDQFSTADTVFIPYVERMDASLFYYKGYSLRQNHPRIADWFKGLETRSVYRGTQSDFHTHAHDLPPQMGGCYSNDTPEAIAAQNQVDQGSWFDLPDVAYTEPETSRQEALARVLKHRSNIIRVNPVEDSIFEEALRCALTWMMTGETQQPPTNSEVGLRYLRDRINVPRDMSIYAGKRLRQALEYTAALVGDRQGPTIPIRNRYDQNPLEFS